MPTALLENRRPFDRRTDAVAHICEEQVVRGFEEGSMEFLIRDPALLRGNGMLGHAPERVLHSKELFCGAPFRGEFRRGRFDPVAELE